MRGLVHGARMAMERPRGVVSSRLTGFPGPLLTFGDLDKIAGYLCQQDAGKEVLSADWRHAGLPSFIGMGTQPGAG